MVPEWAVDSNLLRSSSIPCVRPVQLGLSEFEFRMGSTVVAIGLGLMAMYFRYQNILSFIQYLRFRGRARHTRVKCTVC